ncbi:MAG: hypothetical protein R2828_32500 [Saprospiraceae bacterium]
MADLVSLLEDFLIAEHLRGDEFQRKKSLRDAYGDRDMHDLFEKATEEVSRTLEELPYRNSFYHYESMKNLESFFFHSSTQKHLVKEDYLETINGHLDDYFALTKLQLAAEMKARESILSKKYEISFLAEALNHAEEHQIKNLELALYKKAFLLYKENSQAAFQELKSFFIAELKKLSSLEQQYIFHHLLNFTIRKGNAGENAFIHESFLLYEFGLKEGIIAKNGKILDADFTNICAIGIKVSQFTWVENFIANYFHYLNEEVRENAKTLSLAFLYYGQKAFKKTDELISNFSFTDPFYQLRGKILSLRAVFELFLNDESFYDLFQFNALAFEKFLRRNKTLGSQHKKVYLGFIQNLKQLGNLHLNRKLTKTTRQHFKESILKQKDVTNRDWLIQKVDQL